MQGSEEIGADFNSNIPPLGLDLANPQMLALVRILAVSR